MADKLDVPKVGRPKKINSTIINKLEYAFSYGLSDLEACMFAGITKPTFYDYIKENEEFKERVEVLKSNVKMHAKINLADAVIKNKSIENSKYILEKTCDEFKGKSNIRVDGKIESGTIIQFVNDIPDGEEKETVFGIREDDAL